MMCMLSICDAYLANERGVCGVWGGGGVYGEVPGSEYFMLRNAFPVDVFLHIIFEATKRKAPSCCGIYAKSRE